MVNNTTPLDDVHNESLDDAPQTEKEWNALTRQAMSAAHSNSFQAFVNRLERKALLEQQGNAYGGESDESDADDNRDDNAYDDAYDNAYDDADDNAYDDADDEGEDEADDYEAIEKRWSLWSRAGCPSNTLGPLPGTLGAQEFDDDDDSASYSEGSTLAEDADDRDNCDIHSDQIWCTCAVNQGGRAGCDKHKDSVQCTCGIVAEVADPELLGCMND